MRLSCPAACISSLRQVGASTVSSLSTRIHSAPSAIAASIPTLLFPAYPRLSVSAWIRTEGNCALTAATDPSVDALSSSNTS